MPHICANTHENSCSSHSPTFSTYSWSSVFLWTKNLSIVSSRLHLRHMTTPSVTRDARKNVLSIWGLFWYVKKTYDWQEYSYFVLQSWTILLMLMASDIYRIMVNGKKKWVWQSLKYRRDIESANWLTKAATDLVISKVSFLTIAYISSCKPQIIPDHIC